MSLATAVDEVIKLSAEVRRLHAENDSLIALALLGRWAIETGRYDLKGREIQDKAIEFGLLYEVMATESCGDECRCLELGGWPIACLRMTDKATVLDK